MKRHPTTRIGATRTRWDVDYDRTGGQLTIHCTTDVLTDPVTAVRLAEHLGQLPAALERRVGIIAGSYAQARHWLHRTGLASGDAVWLHQTGDLDALHADTEIYTVGTWDNDSTTRNLVALARARGMSVFPAENDQ